jgi:Schlafen, AlbA_2
MASPSDPAWASRLRAIFGVPVGMVEAKHIGQLIRSKVREDADLDFKQDLYGAADRDKRSLAADIAAMCNGRGGVIVIGVKEVSGAACAKSEVALAETEELRMRQAVAGLTAPHAEFEIRAIRGRSTRTGFYLLIAPPSSLRPHAVRVNDALRYPIRNGASTRYLSEAEVADLYRDRFRGERDQISRADGILDALLGRMDLRGEVLLAVSLVPNGFGSLAISSAGKEQIQSWAGEAFGRRRDRRMRLFPDRPVLVGVGVARYTLMDDVKEQQRHRFYAECHSDGSVAVGIRLDGFRRDDVDFDDGRQGQLNLVSGPSLIWRTATLLNFSGQHAVLNAGAYGDATIIVRLKNAPMQLFHAQRALRLPALETVDIDALYEDWALYQEYVDAAPVGLGRHILIEPESRQTVALSSLVRTSQEVIEATRLVLTDIFHAFNCAEVPYISEEGALRVPYFKDQQLVTWATAHSVKTTDERLSGVRLPGSR